MAITRELKARWLKRLRDPSSKHASGRLSDGKGGMCCLGHLADLQGHLASTGSISHDKLGFHNGTGHHEVCLIEDRDTKKKIYLYGLSKHTQGRLAHLNDSRGKFPIKEIQALKTVEDAERAKIRAQEKSKKKVTKI